jgi:peptidoglycan/LPS O-acetylase OafA/YrhL
MIIQLYIVFPILYFITYNKISAWVGLIAIIPIQLFAKSIPGNVFFLVEGGLPAFYLGLFSARSKIVPVIQRKDWRIVLASISVLLIIGFIFLHNSFLPRSPYQALLIRAALAFLIVLTFKICGGERTPILPFLGKYSAIMYLIHVLFIILIPQIIYYSEHSISAYVVFVGISLIMAIFIDWLEKVSHFDKLRLTLVNRVNNL